MNRVKTINIRKISFNTFLYSFLIIGAIIMFFPFYYMVITSVKPREELLAYPPSFWVYKPTPESYEELFQLIPMFRYILNSIFVATSITLTNLFLSSLAGYAFAKHNFFGRDKIFILILGSMMVPWQVNIIPGFVIVKQLGWLNSFQGLIIPAMVNAFGIFFMRQFISTIPNDIIDAAKIDGCSEFFIFRRIVLPLCKPALATLAIFTFMHQWNNFVWPLIIIHERNLRTVPLSLAVLNAQFGSNFGLLMAGSTVAIAPMIVAFLIMQKYIIRGITLTGLKE